MIDKNFDTPRPIRLDVRLPVGNVEVVTTDTQESSVTVTGTTRMLDATKVELDGDRLVIEMPHKLFRGFSHRLSGEGFQVRATVPHGSRVELASASGDADLNGTFERIDIKTASGDTRVAGQITGDAIVKTVSGDTRLPHVDGNVRVQAVSGSVRADSVDGSVVAKSVSGDVRVDSVREGTVNVQSVSGDVMVGIAPGSNVDVDAASASGSLTSEIPLSNAQGGGTGSTVIVRGKTVSGAVRIFRAA